MLVHYDDSKPLMLACDASPCGLVAALSHGMPDGVDRLVTYDSRTLTTAEKITHSCKRMVLMLFMG